MDNRAGDRTSLVRHEEKLTAAVQRVARGATRVRKRVITETVTVEVEVQREVLEVEEAPAAGDDEVEKFKEFLDNVSPDDFKASGGT